MRPQNPNTQASGDILIMPCGTATISLHCGFTLNCIYGCFVAKIYVFKFNSKCVTICLHNMNLPLFCCDMCIRNCCVAICVLCCIYKPKIMHTQVFTNVSYDSHLFTVDSPLKIQCIENHPLLDQSCRFIYQR